MQLVWLPRSFAAPVAARASPGMSTAAPSHVTLALLPPPPDPRSLWPEKSIMGLSDLCSIVREICDLVQQQGRDIQALKCQVAAMRAEAAAVQEGKSAFISRLTSAARDWDENLAPEEEEHPVSQDEEDWEGHEDDLPTEQYDEEDWEEPGSKKQRRY